MSENVPNPPVARIVPTIFEHLGHTWIANYAWLQNKSDPQVMAYLEAENAYACAQLQHTEALQEQIFQEMKGRIKEDDSSVPARHGDYFYYSRMEAGQQYRIFCRKHVSLDAAEEVLLDENILAQGLAYCRVFVYLPSPDTAYSAAWANDSRTLFYTVFDVSHRPYKLYRHISGADPKNGCHALSRA